MRERLAVCRTAAAASIPAWLLEGGFFCVVRTSDELSIVCPESLVPDNDALVVENGWTALKLEGPFPFSMTGVLASFLDPLAEAGLPVFAVSTFNTDYVLIKQSDMERALTVLRSAGHLALAAV